MTSEYRSPVDIANRALQHVGAEMLDQTLGFAENSKNARQSSFAYGKLRLAELRRNVWTFATRKAPIRPIDTNTLLLTPALWVPTTTYFFGSIVADQNGTLWVSRLRDNLGNDPLLTIAWEPYFGPMTVMLYDSSQTYFAGELVYTFAGDGSFNVYQSQTNANAIHPAVPNQWSVSTTFFKDDVVQAFPTWSNLVIYVQGNTVNLGGNIYSSLTNSNLNNNPSTSQANWVLVPTLTLQSQGVPVSTFVNPPSSTPIKEWLQATTYSLGSFAMFNGLVWLSVANNNTGNFPNVVGSVFWKQLTLGTFYMSLTDLNLGNNPVNSPLLWSGSTTYAIGNQVTGTDGITYTSVTNGNVGHDPTLDNGTNWTNTHVLTPWTTTFIQGGGNQLWSGIGGTQFPTGIGLIPLQLFYPLGSGPLSQFSTSRNIFRVPAGYLRTAHQHPKVGHISPLGAPGGMADTDWEFEGDFIVTSEVQTIIFRFVADVQDVRKFDPMFCEGLAARLALEVCEPITQSITKLQIIIKEYEKFMTEARMVNGIETRAEEPPVDDYISSRF